MLKRSLCRVLGLFLVQSVHLRSLACVVRRAALSRRRPKTINQLEILLNGRLAQSMRGTFDVSVSFEAPDQLRLNHVLRLTSLTQKRFDACAGLFLGVGTEVDYWSLKTQ